MARKAKKTKTTFKRGSRASKIAEERSVGTETENWGDVPADQYRAKMYETLKHYNYFYDYHDAFKWAVEWVKNNKDKTTLKHFKACPDSMISPTTGRFCRIMTNGGQLTENDRAFVERQIEKAVKIGKEKKSSSSDSKVDIPKKSPADIVKENTSEFIAKIEETLDMFDEKGVFIDWDQYSVYEELQAEDAPYNMAKGVHDYYIPLKEELEELVSKKDKQLEEAYSYLGVRKRKKLLKIVTGIVDDAERYMMAKKAVRKPRKKKQTSAVQQVTKVKYLKESKEYKIASVDPTSIVGSSEVYLFNTKYRTVTYLVSSSKTGFEVKGTTIQNIDIEASFKKTIRKPEEFLTDFMKAPKVKSRKTLEALKTKKAEANGRLNDATIIMKVY